MLSQYNICVVPDKQTTTFDRLPVFSILETSIKENNYIKDKKKPQKDSTIITVDRDKGSIDLFRQINGMQMTKLRG